MEGDNHGHSHDSNSFGPVSSVYDHSILGCMLLLLLLLLFVLFCCILGSFHIVIDLLQDLEPTGFLLCATVRISLFHSHDLKR